MFFNWFNLIGRTTESDRNNKGRNEVYKILLEQGAKEIRDKRDTEWMTRIPEEGTSSRIVYDIQKYIDENFSAEHFWLLYNRKDKKISRVIERDDGEFSAISWEIIPNRYKGYIGGTRAFGDTRPKAWDFLIVTYIIGSPIKERYSITFPFHSPVTQYFGDYKDNAEIVAFVFYKEFENMINDLEKTENDLSKYAKMILENIKNEDEGKQ